jgi:hypothetical protein
MMAQSGQLPGIILDIRRDGDSVYTSVSNRSR